MHPRRTDAWEHLSLANEYASRIGGDTDHYGLSFGPSNVRIHEVAAALELEDPDEALRRNEGSVPPQALPPERSSHHYIDLARVQLMAGVILTFGEMAESSLAGIGHAAEDALGHDDALNSAIRLQAELHRPGIASDVHVGYGLALLSVWVGLVVWCHSGRYWWRSGWDARRRRVIYAWQPERHGSSQGPA